MNSYLSVTFYLQILVMLNKLQQPLPKLDFVYKDRKTTFMK